MTHLRRPRSAARESRAGWVPLGLSGRLLVVLALIPLGGVARLAAADLATVGEHASALIDGLIGSGLEIAERFLDPGTIRRAFVGEPMTSPPDRRR